MTSASPASPSSMACPVPTATTSTWLSYSASKSGRIASSSPESAVDVVVASRRTWGSSDPHPAANATTVKSRARMTNRERITVPFS